VLNVFKEHLDVVDSVIKEEYKNMDEREIKEVVQQEEI